MLLKVTQDSEPPTQVPDGFEPEREGPGSSKEGPRGLVPSSTGGSEMQAWRTESVLSTSPYSFAHGVEAARRWSTGSLGRWTVIQKKDLEAQGIQDLEIICLGLVRMLFGQPD